MELNLKFLLKQTFWVYFFSYLALPVAFFIRIIYARSFSLEEFGLIYAIIGFITLVGIFNDFGFTETLNYHATRFIAKKKYGLAKACIWYAVLMQLGTSLLLIIAFYLLSPFLAQHYFKSELAVSALRFFLIFFVSVKLVVVTQAIFKMNHSYFYETMIHSLRMLMILIGSCFILFYPDLATIDYVGAVWAMSCIVMVLIFVPIALRKFPNLFRSKAKFSWKLYKKMFNYAFFVFLGANAGILLSQTDIAVLTYFTNLSDVGIYSVALAVAGILPMVIGPMATFVFPLTSKLNVNKEHSQLRDMINAVYNFGLFCGMPILIIFMSFSDEIISLLFGGEYLSASKILVILSIPLFISIFNTFNFAILAGLGLIRKRLYILFIGALSNVILDIILVINFGVIGAAIGTLLIAILMCILGYSLIRRELSVRINIVSLTKILALSVFVALLMSLMKRIIDTHLLVEASVIVIVAGSVYLTLGLLLKIIDYERLIGIVKSMVYSRKKTSKQKDL